MSAPPGVHEHAERIAKVVRDGLPEGFDVAVLIVRDDWKTSPGDEYAIVSLSSIPYDVRADLFAHLALECRAKARPFTTETP